MLDVSFVIDQLFKHLSQDAGDPLVRILLVGFVLKVLHQILEPKRSRAVLPVVQGKPTTQR